nr:MAG TPA: hypothetical protein [Caudoviricetes sp.]
MAYQGVYNDSSGFFTLIFQKRQNKNSTVCTLL